MITRQEAIQQNKPIKLFKGNKKGVITLHHDGQWITAHKDTDENKEYHFNLKEGIYYSHYYNNRTDKPIHKNSIKAWFNSDIITYDSKIATLILYNIKRDDMTRYVNPTYFIEALSNTKCQNLEKWLGYGIQIQEIEDMLQTDNIGLRLKVGYGRRETIQTIYANPSKMEKEVVEYIKKIKKFNIEQLNQLRNTKYKKLKNFNQLKEYEKQEAYSTIFTKNERRYGQITQRSILDDYDRWDTDTLLNIIETYNLDIDRFVKYLKHLKDFEHTDINWVLWNYKDYLNAELTLRNGKKRKMDKYPRNLVQAHHQKTSILAEIQREKERLKQEEQKKKDKKIYENKKYLEYVPKDNEYCIIVPNDADDVINEGTSLNHCVGTYTNKISNKETFIVFMRHQKNKNKPFITVEINKHDALCTALGQGNRRLNTKEKQFLQRYCVAKDLEYIAYGVV